MVRVSGLADKVAFDNAELLRYRESDQMYTIWIPLPEENGIKMGLHFTIYNGEVQNGFLTKWLNDDTGKVTVKQSNLAQEVFIEYSSGLDNKITLDMVNAKKAQSAIVDINNSNARLAQCSFTKNFNTCVGQYLSQLSTNAIAGLACLAYGAECAVIITATCAIDASNATSQEKCIGTANPS